MNEMLNQQNKNDPHSLMSIAESSRSSSRIRALVICNAYPSEKALYRNGFIHRRVKAYQEADLDVEIFYHHEPAAPSYEYEYDGVCVTVGNSEALYERVSQESYDIYLVHFAEPGRVEPLERAGVTAPVIVWIHGYEAEAWHRRWFNFIQSAKLLSQVLEKKDQYYKVQNNFLRKLVEESDLNISFVNVSEWFQRYVVEPDLGVEFENSVVIPNLVDESLFQAHEKDPSMRKKILSIRPYASRKYANDLTVKAILELSKRPYFKDLEFTLCGQGELFESTTKPLRKFDNIKLHNSFFTQDEIVDLHRQHGVFLSPTRFDSQGVSMCEAMSSGLVVLSTDIAAVPEYIRHGSTGLLSRPESYKDIANNIERIYFDEELFAQLSTCGSGWMHRNCGLSATIGREISLIEEKVGAHEG